MGVERKDQSCMEDELQGGRGEKMEVWGISFPCVLGYCATGQGCQVRKVKNTLNNGLP